MSFDTARLLGLETHATAPLLVQGRWLTEVTPWGLSPVCRETGLGLQVRETRQKPTGSTASANRPQKEMCVLVFLCLPAGCYFRSWLFQPSAERHVSGRKLLCVSCGLFFHNRFTTFTKLGSCLSARKRRGKMRG